MKKLIPLFILIFAFGISAQVKQRLKTTPTPQTVTPVKTPTQKVSIEKTNGDKLTGLFVSGNEDSITIQISGTNVPISLSEIAVMWIGEAKPAPVTPQTPAIDYAASAIKSLKKLSAATDVGVNFQDYSRRVIDVKAEVEDVLPNITDDYVKTEIKLAMDAYVDAGSAWNFTIQNRGYLFIDFEPAKTLRPKYNLPTSKLGSLTLISQQDAISTIWAAAKTHIENAQNGKPQ